MCVVSSHRSGYVAFLAAGGVGDRGVDREGVEEHGKDLRWFAGLLRRVQAAAGRSRGVSASRQPWVGASAAPRDQRVGDADVAVDVAGRIDPAAGLLSRVVSARVGRRRRSAVGALCIGGVLSRVRSVRVGGSAACGWPLLPQAVRAVLSVSQCTRSMAAYALAVPGSAGVFHQGRSLTASRMISCRRVRRSTSAVDSAFSASAHATSRSVSSGAGRGVRRALTWKSAAGRRVRPAWRQWCVPSRGR